MKKIICMVSVVIATLIAPAMLRAEQWSVPESTPSQVFASGDGSESNPYIIKTAQQLANFAYMVYWCYDYYEGKYIALDSDIVLNDNVVANAVGAKPWMPIGSEGSFNDGKFYGTFDGRGHTISGLYINENSTISGYAGLFGTVKGDGVVKNVNVKDAVIDLSNFTRHYLYVGGIVGYTTDNAQVTGCTFEGNIYGYGTSQYQGGIVGYHNSYKDLTDCHVTGNVGFKQKADDRSKYGEYVGGIAGYSYSSVLNCTARANVWGCEIMRYYYLGGIVGYCKKNVVNCITYGTDADGEKLAIKSKASVVTGGVVGEADFVSHCLNYADVETTGDQPVTGGVAGSANTVEYSANFGRVYSSREPLGIRVGSIGGIAGKAYYMNQCVNYGYMEFPNSKQSYDRFNVKYAWYGGIAGRCYTGMKNCLNVGRVKYAQFDYLGSISDISYGVCSQEGLEPMNTYWLDTEGTCQATPQGNGSMVVTLDFLQTAEYLNMCSSTWGMAWGLDPATKYPMPMKWGGQDRDYVLSGITVGDGTEANPYVINSVATFNGMNNMLKDSFSGLKDVWFKQVGDLDFAGEAFMPIGMYYDEAEGKYVNKEFYGHYDGGGYTVRNIEYSYDGDCNVGFISTMADLASLSNLNFQNVRITLNNDGTTNKESAGGIAVGSYTMAGSMTYTPISNINVLACSIMASGRVMVGGVAGVVATTCETGESNLTVSGCTVHHSIIETSRVAGGIAGLVANTKISHSTAASDFRTNASSPDDCHIGGLIGCNGYNDGFEAVIWPHFEANYCVAIPNVDYDYVGTADKAVYVGGIMGTNDEGGDNRINNTLVDIKPYTGGNYRVYTGLCTGEAKQSTFKLKYVEFSAEVENLNGAGADASVYSAESDYKTVTELGGWSTYYLNGNSNKGDMKWGYYYPTASPQSYAVTSANGRYTHYDLANASKITAPEVLYVDFTLPAVPLDNNVLTAAEGTSISQALVAAKANLVSQNGVASRLYLHDKMDFTYPGSFETYTVHYKTSYGDPQWQVLCLPFEVRSDMLPEGSEMYEINLYSGGKAIRNEISVAEAGEPFILCHDGILEIDCDEYNGTVTGTATTGEYLAGSFVATQAAAGDYVLSEDGKNFVRLTGATSIEPFRGYVPAAAFPGGGDNVPVSDNATAVDDVAAQRTMISGTEGAVVIEGAEGVARIYTAGGAVVKQVAVSGIARVALAPGLYIVELGGNKAKVAVK